jgi:hypothetical protein
VSSLVVPLLFFSLIYGFLLEEVEVCWVVEEEGWKQMLWLWELNGEDDIYFFVFLIVFKSFLLLFNCFKNICQYVDMCHHIICHILPHQ